MKAGTLRHIANINRPRKALDARGQNSGGEDTLLADVPCSLQELSGREAEQAHKLYADATIQVEMYGDPKKPISTNDILVIGTRRLSVGHVHDLQSNGIELRLLCGEARK